MATGGVMTWSKTAATNATADPAVGWAEGQAPSSVNDSARAEMASVAKWRDDISGTLTTGGTSTAYTLTTNATFATAAAMSGAMITFIPHATNGASPTLAVDGLTARAINISTGVAVPTGALVLGTPYTVTYVHASTEFILHNAVAALTATMFSTGDVKLTLKTSADAGWVMCNDGTIGDGSSSATTRANADTVDLYTLLWTNVSDTYAAVSTGRGISAAADFAAHKTIALTKMLGRALAMSGAGSGLTSRALGLTAGEETHALTAAENGPHGHAGSTSPATAIDNGSGTTTLGPQSTHSNTQVAVASGFNVIPSTDFVTQVVPSMSLTIASAGSGTGHNNMQPTAFLNAMIKL